ncbi:MAG: hypothetical protein ACLTBV_00300 [Enterocloster bolteae]
MKPIFKSSLIKDVVISYVCMIVFPVMIILGMVFLLAGRYIYRAATESVTVTQQAVLELYERRNARLGPGPVAGGQYERRHHHTGCVRL